MNSKAKGDNNIGGFVGVNIGTIEESYSKVIFSNKVKATSFCAKNNGQIKKCFSSGLVNKTLISKFCEENTQVVEESLLDMKNNSKDLKDSHKGISTCDFTVTSLNQVNFEDNVPWLPSDESVFISDAKFNSKNYYYKTECFGKNECCIKISTYEQLINIGKDINEGNSKYTTKTYILQNDIDLKGCKWTPIGSEISPFSGTFDGQGYKIYNFKVIDKKAMFTGFFGYTDNASIYNLYVDGIIKTGKCAGTFVGISKNSKIICCGASSHIKETKFTGGFIGKNEGIIQKCYYKGKIKKSFLDWLVFLIPTSILLILTFLYLFNPYNKMSIFKNIPIDNYAVKMEEMSYSGDQNKASFGFSDTIEFYNGEGSSNIINPGNANQSVRFSLQITDEELLTKIGSTGRTDKEQKELESNPVYNSTSSRVTVSQSGLIPPGYGLPKIILEKLPNGEILPKGAYRAVVFLSFYNYSTNEKAIINSQIPVLMIVN